MNVRQQQILDLVARHKLVNAETLQTETKASPATIRRDLTFLERQGHIERFHGGARLSKKNHYELSFERRAKLEVERKTAIAQKASSFIEDGEVILLGAGTTTLYMARELAKRQKTLSIITNNLFIAQEAANYPTIDLNLLGGKLDYANMESIGPAALEALSHLVVDKVFIGVNALSPKHGGMSIFEHNAHLYRSMTGRAKKVFVVADSSKSDAQASYIAVPLKALHTLITDEQMASDTVAKFKKQGVKVHF